MKFTMMQRLRYMSMFYRYLMHYGNRYSESTRAFLKENFLKITEIGYIPDVLEQLYAKFGMFSEEENTYLGFAKMIGDVYGYDINILEVAGGYYPIFSQYIDDFQQKENNGTITVIDPLLVIEKLGKVSLQKKEFSHDMNVSDFDLLVGICPCEATEEIIKSAVINKKEFFIAMCGCIDVKNYGWMWGFEREFIYNSKVDKIFCLAQEQEKDGFEVQKQYIKNFNYPIISSKRKK